MSNKSEAAGGGIGFTGVLFVVFLTLKLCGVINWSWWCVTSPLWLPLTVILAIVAVVLGGAMALAAWDDRQSAKRRAKMLGKK